MAGTLAHLKSAGRNKTPAKGLSPEHFFLTFVKRGNESFMAVGDTFLTGLLLFN
jgi:hypothetical protein